MEICGTHHASICCNLWIWFYVALEPTFKKNSDNQNLPFHEILVEEKKTWFPYFNTPFHNPYLKNKGNSFNHFTSNLSNPTQPRCFFSTCIPLAVAMGHPSSPRIIAWPSTSFLFNRRHPSRRQNGCQELVGVYHCKNTIIQSVGIFHHVYICLLYNIFIHIHTNNNEF